MRRKNIKKKKTIAGHRAQDMHKIEVTRTKREKIIARCCERQAIVFFFFFFFFFFFKGGCSNLAHVHVEIRQCVLPAVWVYVTR